MSDEEIIKSFKRWATQTAREAMLKDDEVMFKALDYLANNEFKDS